MEEMEDDELSQRRCTTADPLNNLKGYSPNSPSSRKTLRMSETAYAIMEASKQVIEGAGVLKVARIRDRGCQTSDEALWDKAGSLGRVDDERQPADAW